MSPPLPPLDLRLMSSAVRHAILGMCLQVVDGWNVDMKQRFVAFVTGGQRPCPMGPEVLNIVLAWVPPEQQTQAAVAQRLPQVRP